MVSVRVLGLEVVIWPTAKSILEQGKDRAGEIQQSMYNTCAVYGRYYVGTKNYDKLRYSFVFIVIVMQSRSD